VQIGSLLGVLDRRDKDAIALLFAAIPNNPSVKAQRKEKEFKKAGFRKFLPGKLRRPLNTFDLPEEILSKRRRKFEPQHINSRRKAHLRIYQGFSVLELKKSLGLIEPG
jgi:hypothetical protein